MRVRRIYREILTRTEKGVKKNAHVCINVFFLRFFFFMFTAAINSFYMPVFAFSTRSHTRSSRCSPGTVEFFSRKPVPCKSGRRLLFPHRSTRANNVRSENRADRFQKKSSLNKEKYGYPPLGKVAYVAALCIGI